MSGTCFSAQAQIKNWVFDIVRYIGDIDSKQKVRSMHPCKLYKQIDMEPMS